MIHLTSFAIRLTPGFRSAFFALVGLLTGLAPVAAADIVTRRDGRIVEGEVVTVDASSVVVKTLQGPIRISRSQVASIRFDAEGPVNPPLKVEIRNVRSDDAVDVLLDGEPVLREGRDGGEWIDLTPKLKDGNNPLQLRIRNDRATWAYRLSLRINGAVTILSCGTAGRQDDPCQCCGKSGRETGVIDDLPIIWLHVERALGRAEVAP